MTEIGQGIRFTTRGDPAASDYTKASFTIDGSSHNLDISSIIGIGEKLVLIRIRATATLAAHTILLYHPDETNLENAGRLQCSVANVSESTDLLVRSNESGVISYLIGAAAANWTSINMTIGGWFD